MSKNFDIMALMPLLIMFVLFYFLLIRPQQNKLKAHQEMLSKIKKGDKVVTNGGLIGTVTKASDEELTLEIADDVRVHVMRNMVSGVLTTSSNKKEKE